MAGEVGFADVGLGFRDDPGKAEALLDPDETRPEQFPGKDKGGPFKERTRKGFGSHCNILGMECSLGSGRINDVQTVSLVMR
jgi:hypothetical protein